MVFLFFLIDKFRCVFLLWDIVFRMYVLLVFFLFISNWLGIIYLVGGKYLEILMVFNYLFYWVVFMIKY